MCAATAGAEALVPYQLHVTCKPKTEPRLRTLLVQDTGPSEVIFLRGIDTTRAGDGGETRLTAHLLAGRDAAPHLEQLVSRLTLEPGIRGVHWRSADELGAPLVPAPTAAAKARFALSSDNIDWLPKNHPGGCGRLSTGRSVSPRIARTLPQGVRQRRDLRRYHFTKL